ncbi:MAG: aminotransferase class IV, partial [Acidimicrobiia bacterium]
QSELTGAKTLSYGPNLAATIEARSKGFDDAALIGSAGDVLEGPTFSLGWVSDGAMCTPGLERHILASITREVTIDAARNGGIAVREERFPRSALLEADEVFIMSTVREVLPVTAVGDTELEPGPVTARLRDGFGEIVRAETV